MWFQKGRRKQRKVVRRRSRRTSTHPHYKAHKELARGIILTRVSHWNQHYNFNFNRVAIRNQRSCWGSCSEKGNLNFNYKIIFLPEQLMDYIIVHELCHLAELNHSSRFWGRVAETIPTYKEHRQHLRKMTHIPSSGFPSSVFRKTVYM